MPSIDPTAHTHMMYNMGNDRLWEVYTIISARRYIAARRISAGRQLILGGGISFEERVSILELAVGRHYGATLSY
ncbi:hypothetical protein L211DRAFT_838169 [Terfezia boudieri ATCC MYA-4762]|uniref:Uncharacterized protein n=1 Tax=Terfezia boudieri ATCC MYA-4762 TaxID=1051890 RepID=A0A3N4LLR5_9PEZI|nr:hypothetical protein L211DRAFT_838169 [Terfezia boudieri ATCC MYA-4762]